MPDDLPFLRGQQVILKFFAAQSELILNAKNFDFGENTTIIADPVCGEDADRLDAVGNFWEFSCDCYSRKHELLLAFLADRANDIAGAAPIPKGAGVRVAPRDGTRIAYVASQISWDGVRTTIGGRTERNMFKVTWRARYFKPAKAA